MRAHTRSAGRFGQVAGPATPGEHPGHVARPDTAQPDVAWVAERFAEAWAEPDIDNFMALLHADVVLTQPVGKPIRGRAEARREFERMFRLFPDLHGAVDNWSSGGDLLMIAWRLRATIGRRVVQWRIADHIRVKDGLIVERDALFDPTDLLLAILRAGPVIWVRYLKYRGYLPGW